MNGILLINKTKGVTSRDCINDLNHILHTKKIGHTGTLDPIATGVLVCTIGNLTKLGDDLMSTYKEYQAEMILGYETDTLDVTGVTTKTSTLKVNEEEIKKTILSFKGEYNQEVPIYSSVKINGKKLYEYARNHEDVELPKRLVDIKEIEILSIKDNKVCFKVLVSKGTYIRSLIRDIGVKLGTYATMSELCRTKQGKFNIEDSYLINDVRNNNYKLLSLEDVLDLEVVNTDDELYKKINNGVKLDNNYSKEYVLFKYNNEDVSLYKKDDKLYRYYLKLNKKD